MNKRFCIFLCCLAVSWALPLAAQLELLNPGDTVQRSGDTYTIENNDFQQIRSFTQVGPSAGALILYGGGDLSDNMLQLFADEIGGVDSKIAAITTAACWAEILDAENDYLGHLLDFGFTDIEVLHTRNPEIANSQVFSEKLNGASGIWIGGGGPECLLAPYLHTNFHDALGNFLNNGGVIAGTSAGAMVLGSYYQANHGEPVRVGRIEFEGFGFMRSTTIAAHIDTFENGFEEQIVDVIDDYYPGLLGIGLSENSAAIINGDTLSFYGQGYARIYDGRTVETIVDGDRYDLAGRHQR